MAGPLVFSEIGKSAVRPLFTTPTLGSLLEDEEAVLVAECHRAATVAARHAAPSNLGRASGAAPRRDAALPAVRLRVRVGARVGEIGRAHV